MDLPAAFYDALTSDSTVKGYLGTYLTTPCVFTKVPVPSEAPFPMLVVMPPASVSDFDYLNAKKLYILQDLIVYGEQDSDYRDVEALAWYLRNLFHREKDVITVTGWNVMDITVFGPTPAPVSDEKHVARRVELTILLSKN